MYQASVFGSAQVRTSKNLHAGTFPMQGSRLSSLHASSHVVVVTMKQHMRVQQGLRLVSPPLSWSRLGPCQCFTGSKASNPEDTQDHHNGEEASPSTSPAFSPSHIAHLHQYNRLSASIPPLPLPPQPTVPTSVFSTQHSSPFQQGLQPSTPSKPSFWMLLLRYFITLTGRALRALAIAFCLLALLLMRPRVAGAYEASPTHSFMPYDHPTATVATTSSTPLHSWHTRKQQAASPSTTTTSPPPWHPIIACISSSLLPPVTSAHTARAQQHTQQRSLNPLATIADSNALHDSPIHTPTLDVSTSATQDQSGTAGTAPAALAPAAVLTAHEAAVTALFKAAQASVVNISGARAAGTFSSLDVSRHVPGLGSGFVWDDRGHVITTYSCVRGAAEVKVTLADASSYTAKLVGADPGKDLAVLRLSMPKARLKELTPIKPGVCHGPGGLSLGATLWAVGNVTGLDHTITQGVVSGLGRELPGGGPYPLKALIQVDGACGHQAGGLLINSQGKAVGMVVAPSQADGRAAGYGLGYALPLDTIRGLVAQILAAGKTSRPTLGITIAPPQVLAAQGVEGVLVLEVPPGSPAAAAGLRHTHRDIFGDVILGDVIVGIEGGAVRHAGDLYSVLDSRKAGERVRVDVLRDGKSTSLTVVLGERGQAGALEE